MKNAIIILNYNDYENTINYLNRIKNYKNLDLIVVVDNNSIDDSYKKLNRLSTDKIIVLKSNKNNGYGSGNNIGIKYAIDKLSNCNIIISNPDIEVEDKVIGELSKKISTSDKIAIVAPTIIELGKLNRGWKLSNGFQEVLLSTPIIGSKLKNNIIGYKANHFFEKYSKVDVVSGCFFMIKSKVMEEINYFDENLFLYYEENVISKKIKNLNLDVIILNNFYINHMHSVTIDKNNGSFNKFKILKNSQKYYLDNYCNASFLSKLIIKMWTKIIMLYKK